MKIEYPSEEQCIFWRRQLHSHAEPGFAEFWTTVFIYSELKDLPVTIRFGKEVYDRTQRFGVMQAEDLRFWQERALKQGADGEALTALEGITGLVVDIFPETSAEKEVRTLLRFDIDAVALEESSASGHIPHRLGFASKNPGYCHACGHDGHTAIGIAVAKTLAGARKFLRHGVRIVFQPAEEGVRGAAGLKHLCRDVRYAVIGHIGMNADVSGSLVCGAYGFFATKKFNVRFGGVSAHAGAEPEKGKNALLAACCAVLNLYAMPRHGGGETRVNVGVLQAGTAANVIADKAFFSAEIRGETSEVCADLMRQAENIIAGAAVMYGLEYSIEYTGFCDSGRSDEELAAVLAEAAGEIPYFRPDKCRLSGKGYGSDDACTYMRAVQQQGGKAVYCMLGSDLPAGHHKPLFDFDERVLLPACMLFVKTVFRLDCAE